MNYFMSAFFIGSSIAFAGGSMGGGTPPARQELEMAMMSQPTLDGGLFTEETGDIGLLSKVELQPEMQVNSGTSGSGSPPSQKTTGWGSGGGTPPALTLSADDVMILRDKIKRLDAVGGVGQNLSFDVLPGDALGTVTLKDRRLTMRDSLKKSQNTKN